MQCYCCSSAIRTILKRSRKITKNVFITKVARTHFVGNSAHGRKFRSRKWKIVKHNKLKGGFRHCTKAVAIFHSQPVNSNVTFWCSIEIPLWNSFECHWMFNKNVLIQVSQSKSRRNHRCSRKCFQESRENFWTCLTAFFMQFASTFALEIWKSSRCMTSDISCAICAIRTVWRVTGLFAAYHRILHQ